MTRATSGAWAMPVNSCSPAVAGTAINPTDFEALLTDIEGGFNERIHVSVSASKVALSNSSTSAQNIFAAANDTLTVAGSKTYMMRGIIMLNTGNTDHITSFTLGGTATYTSVHYLMSGTTSAAATLATPQRKRVSVATVIAVAATSTAVTCDFEFSGIIRVNAAGTIIPQVTFSAGPTGTCEVELESFFELIPIGSDSVAAIPLASWG